MYSWKLFHVFYKQIHLETVSFFFFIELSIHVKKKQQPTNGNDLKSIKVSNKALRQLKMHHHI